MSKPDFTGEWSLNTPASPLSPFANTVQSGSWVIEHREPAFHHKASYIFESGPRDYEYEIPSTWDGDVLVVSFREPVPGQPTGEMTVTFRYELVDQGRRIRASEQVRGTSWDQDNIWIFDRR